MNIDENARKRLLQKIQHEQLLNVIQSQPKPEYPDITEPIEKVQKTNSNQLAISALTIALLKKVSSVISDIFNKVPSREDVEGVKQAVKDISIPSVPEVIKIQSEELLEAVKGIKIPEHPTDITIDNLHEIVDQFDPLIKAVENLKQSQTQKVEVVNPPKLDTSRLENALDTFLKKLPVAQPIKKEKQAPLDLSELTNLLSEIRDSLDEIKPPVIEFPKTISIDNFPPQKVAQPVTNININGLQGFVKTTANTVGTTVVSLPNYGQLFNRRAVQIYNNSNNTIYIGGSDVTVSNGIPVPANSYSNIIDAGYNMVVYGVSAQNGNDIRVLEVSKDKTSNVQQ